MPRHNFHELDEPSQRRRGVPPVPSAYADPLVLGAKLTGRRAPLRMIWALTART